MLHKLFLIYSCLFACSCFAQRTGQRADSLKNLLQQHTIKDTNRVVTLIRYANVLYYLQPDSSLMKYADEALQIAEQIKWNEGIARSLQFKGVVYNSFWNDPIKALDCYQKALKMNENIGNKGFQFTVLVDIGIIHFDLNECEQALRYFNQAYTILQQLKDKKGEDLLLINMAQAYNKLKQNTKAEEFYTEGIALAEKSGNIQVVANALCSRGFLYQKEKKLNLAKDDLERGVALAEKYNLISIQVEGLINLAETYTDLKDYKVAEKYAKEALQLSRLTHMRQLEAQTIGTLADVYSANGNAKKALAYYKQYQPMNDSLLSDETKQSLTRMEMQFQFKQKQDSIKAENEKQQAQSVAKLQQQHIVNSSIVGGAGVLLLAGFISFIFYKKRRDAEGQKQEAEFLTQVANTEMKALRAQMNPHFIFNSLNSIADYIDKNQTRIASDFTTKFAKLMRMVLENSEQKEIPLADDLKALELYMQLESLRLKNKFTYQIKVDENIDKENTLIPPLILQPFVENSIWHGIANKEEDGQIVIYIKKAGEMINCIVEDDGGGMGDITSASEEKKSLGMKITKARIDIINKLKNADASMNVSNKEKGVRAEVRLPLELSF